MAVEILRISFICMKGLPSQVYTISIYSVLL